MGFAAVVPCPGRICGLRVPFENRELRIAALNHKPVNRIAGYYAADFTSEFLKRCHNRKHCSAPVLQSILPRLLSAANLQCALESRGESSVEARRQLPVCWPVGVLVAVLTGLGPAVRLLVARDGYCRGSHHTVCLLHRTPPAGGPEGRCDRAGTGGSRPRRRCSTRRRRDHTWHASLRGLVGRLSLFIFGARWLST